ncbi:lipopolysaccharide/colanic/teichoic acid biosynthesis glycosyltransferase [Maribacter caenipelagi]|uniref:Lipopolysaccharide/colanic/teichoic acid biosynthesis glycosyltransferase n=1 Tax=Maribacter caenipelagi TaxID=1447781 RepID=A0A4R7CYM4_9FLAO|nr:sugar transferase [Maribacter caenipelagi]TDS13430.1 lipopolysaccharide/colanic/teichoic acid biosynthesis glycosyltransferase [Maribacter caenipelagi]
MYKKYFKRPLDFFLALFGFLLVLPIVFITAVILAISFKESPFFIQRRPGRHEKIFSILKLKTMNNKRDAEGNLLPDSERLTPLGIFVRKTSIDELPQLLNVIKGEMSLIGPRPLLIRYLPYYTTEERKRFSARPGITGLAQVSGRNLITWESKFENDVTYVENLTFANDVKILWMTFQKVLKSADIEVDPNANPTTEAMDLIRQRQPEFQHIQPIS